MNRRKRRIIACLLALTLVLSSGGISALAKEDTGSTGGTVSEEPQEKTGSQTSGQDTSVEENDGEATGEQTGSETSSETDQTQGETGTTTNGQPAENTQQTGMQVIGWNWIDEDGVLQNTENVWGLGVPGASEENPLTQDALLEMLPKEVELTLSDGSEKTAALTWDLSAIPAEGIWSGDVTVTATVDGTYSFADGTAPIEVKVELGGAETMMEYPQYFEQDTVSPTGTTINLFDYWLENPNSQDYGTDGWNPGGTNNTNYQNMGINQGKHLRFLATSGMETTDINTWQKFPTQGILASQLKDGYPALAASHGGDSLAYLFDESSQDGKAAYTKVEDLLQVDDQGYFYYDAEQNFASFDEENNRFNVYNTWGVKKSNAFASNNNGQFFPFNSGSDVFEVGYRGLEQKNVYASNTQNPKLNHWFGLTMTSRFVQKDGGTTTFQGSKVPVTYEFSGDDDVWIFIDGVLVGDLGGIHDAARITIDFSTGNIEIRGGSNVSEDPNMDTTIREMFQKAGAVGNASKWDGNTFADDTYHTLNFYYLERGSGASNMKLKYNLETIPESSVIKVDQTGAPVAGAKFVLKTDIGTQIATGETKADGTFIFYDENEFPISIADLYTDYKDHNLILEETEVPSGYRSSGAMKLRFHVAEPSKDILLLSDNEWETGAYAMSHVTAKLPETVQVDNNSDGIFGNTDVTKTTANAEMLFAVVMQKQEDGSWKPVYGDPLDGWHVTQGDDIWENIKTAASNDIYRFTLDPSGAYQVTVDNLPGDITKYYFVNGQNEKEAEYTVAYYYSDAESIDQINSNNTYPINPEANVGAGEIDRVFSVSLYVPNIQNNLYVQKLDESGQPVSAVAKGIADFALYSENNVTVGSDGRYTFMPGVSENDGYVQKVTTSDMEDPLPLEGGAIFRGIPKGTYYLIETKAPNGYLASDTAVKVIVDDTGVYADAGKKDDDITVQRGVGSIVHSMIQFAADDDVDATLHDIKAFLQTTTDINTGNWTDSNDPELHLQFVEGSDYLNYSPQGESTARYFEVDEGWSKLLIQQCMDTAHTSETSSTKQKLDDTDLTNLFSGTVVVRVKNQQVNSLTISKTVVDESGTAPSEQRFTFTIEEISDVQLAASYPTEGNGNQGTQGVTFAGEKTAITLADQESLTIRNLPSDAVFKVTESDVDGHTYTTTYSINGAEAKDGKEATDLAISGTEGTTVAFTNTYVPTADFQFQKTDGEDTALNGAAFGLYKLDCKTQEHDHSEDVLKVDKDGNLTSDSTNGCWTKVTTTTSAQKTGLVSFEDLEINAEYRLVEYQAPDGYVLPDGQWILKYSTERKAFEISGAVNEAGTPAFEESKDSNSFVNGENAYYRVRNYKPGELPFSGNTGILMFLLLGAILMGAGAGGTIWYQHTHRRRRSLR